MPAHAYVWSASAVVTSSGLFNSHHIERRQRQSTHQLHTEALQILDPANRPPAYTTW